MDLYEIRNRIIQDLNLSDSDLNVLGRAYESNLIVKIGNSGSSIELPAVIETKTDFREYVQQNLGIAELDELRSQAIDFYGKYGSLEIISRGIPF